MIDYITENTLLLGGIGFFAPYIIPLLFGFVERIFKRELNAQDKKFLIFAISVLVVGIVVGTEFKFVGDFWRDVLNIIEALAVNGFVFVGMVNTVYINIVKYFPGIDQRLETLEKLIKN